MQRGPEWLCFSLAFPRFFFQIREYCPSFGPPALR
jgi:hypothetical protein